MFLKRLQIRELAQAVLPHHFPKFARMTEQELQAESEGGAVVLDIRHGVAFAEGHFPGSLNVGLASREFVHCVGLFLSKQNRIFLVVDQSEQGANCLARGLNR
jgi:rhodanese-related sulfurtransferase